MKIKKNKHLSPGFVIALVLSALFLYPSVLVSAENQPMKLSGYELSPHSMKTRDSGDDFTPPSFGPRMDLGALQYSEIDEASGIAASRRNRGVLWVHNDSGDTARFFAIDTSGRLLGIYNLYDCEARDWEDTAIGPGPEEGVDYLLAGDIGDNSASSELKTIYRIEEPTVDPNQEPVEETLYGADKITFCYPDLIQDAEALMVDPLSGDIYIITKILGRVYRLPFPQSTTEIITAEKITSLHLGAQLTTAADISESGLEILTKTYARIYYWYREPEEPLWTAFDKDPIQVPYIPEPQGEAVAWRAGDDGYFTVSEKKLIKPSHIFLYPRLNIIKGYNGID